MTDISFQVPALTQNFSTMAFDQNSHEMPPEPSPHQTEEKQQAQALLKHACENVLPAADKRRLSAIPSPPNLYPYPPLIHAQILNQLIQQSGFDPNQVDNTSFSVMIEALKFAEINTIEQAERLNLQIIPPGPVFHTWYAKYGTGIFNGQNNPSDHQGLDYVTRIKTQASQLQKWGVPLLIVYLEKNLPKQEEKEMQDALADHDNILLLSYEKDLTALKYQSAFLASSMLDCNFLPFLDTLRFAILREFPLFLDMATRHAIAFGKTELAESITQFEGQSIIYSDIDNTFTQKPIWQIAAQGIHTVACFHNDFTRFLPMRLEETKKGEPLQRLVLRHQSALHHETYHKQSQSSVASFLELEQANLRLFEYLTSEDFKQYCSFAKAYPKFKYFKSMFLQDEIGYLSINRQWLDNFSQSAEPSNKPYNVNWHHAWAYSPEHLSPTLSEQVSDKKLRALQRVYHLHIGRDGTWQ